MKPHLRSLTENSKEGMTEGSPEYMSGLLIRSGMIDECGFLCCVRKIWGSGYWDNSKQGKCHLETYLSGYKWSRGRCCSNYYRK